MIASLTQTLTGAITSRAAGPAASAAALALAGVLAGVWTTAAHREAVLQAQVGALAARNEQAGAYWRAQLTTCRAEAAQPTPVHTMAQEGAITRGNAWTGPGRPGRGRRRGRLRRSRGPSPRGRGP